MEALHGFSQLTAQFDEPNLVSCAGLSPVVALASACGLPKLVRATLTVPGSAGANAAAKVSALVAGMVAGADSIDDLDLLRHGGMGRLFGGIRAPSTLGTFLRAFTFGHVRQLDAVAAKMVARLAARSPLLGGAATVAFVDVDDTVKQTYGYAKTSHVRTLSSSGFLILWLGVPRRAPGAPGSVPARAGRAGSRRPGDG